MARNESSEQVFSILHWTPCTVHSPPHRGTRQNSAQFLHFLCWSEIFEIVLSGNFHPHSVQLLSNGFRRHTEEESVRKRFKTSAGITVNEESLICRRCVSRMCVLWTFDWGGHSKIVAGKVERMSDWMWESWVLGPGWGDTGANERGRSSWNGKIRHFVWAVFLKYFSNSLFCIALSVEIRVGNLYPLRGLMLDGLTCSRKA